MADTLESLQKTPLAATPPPVMPMEKPVMAQKPKNSPVLTVILAVVIVISGMGTGYALSQMSPVKSSAGAITSKDAPDNPDQVKVGAIYGEKDDKKFPDGAEGVLVIGGINGEGTHHLIRPGGKDQYVYLTSSVINLDSFAGDKVSVRGETFQAQTAGWLMDVGQVKVLELNAGPSSDTSPTPEPASGD